LYIKSIVKALMRGLENKEGYFCRRRYLLAPTSKIHAFVHQINGQGDDARLGKQRRIFLPKAIR
jgi:hypothetical protein